jgi:hypothetical protein
MNISQRLRNTLPVFSLIGATLLLNSCGNSSSDSENMVANDSAQSVNNAKDTKAQNVFYSIPSPIETTSLLKAAGAKYNASYLNSIDNVSKYTTVKSKALNLGVYGSDLSFTSIFDQTQESMLYLQRTNKLATSLGISGAFDESTTARIEANLENRDSLLTIISDSYWNADSYLKNNGQPGVSALIIAGGWMEGLYIATKIANDTKNADIVARIGEQKLSLNNLVALLESCKSENEGVNEMLIEMQGLQKIFEAIPSSSTETTSTTDKATGMTTIGNGNSFKLSPELLKQISDKAAEIRNKITE